MHCAFCIPVGCCGAKCKTDGSDYEMTVGATCPGKVEVGRRIGFHDSHDGCPVETQEFRHGRVGEVANGSARCPAGAGDLKSLAKPALGHRMVILAWRGHRFPTLSQHSCTTSPSPKSATDRYPVLLFLKYTPPGSHTATMSVLHRRLPSARPEVSLGLAIEIRGIARLAAS